MSNKSFLISTCLLLLTAVAVVAIAARGEPVVVEKRLQNLPMQIGKWHGHEIPMDPKIHEILQEDISLSRQYIWTDQQANWSTGQPANCLTGQRISLYIGYYGTAKGGRTGHNPYACLPGAGWGIVKAHKVQLTAHSSQLTKYYPNGVGINYVLAQKGETYESVLHWYQSDGNKILATGIEQNIQRFLGRVLRNRNDGAFVRVSAFTDKSHTEEADKLTKFFAEKVLALLPKYWPVEK